MNRTADEKSRGKPAAGQDDGAAGPGASPTLALPLAAGAAAALPGSALRSAARDDRLKAALKANMGRRKAQAKARTDTDRASDGGAVPLTVDETGAGINPDKPNE